MPAGAASQAPTCANMSCLHVVSNPCPYTTAATLCFAMQTLGYSGERTGAAPAPSLLERAGWLEKVPLTLMCGALLGFSTAAYGVWWLAWFGVAPLILLIFGSRSKTDAALTGLLFGIAYHMVGLRWLFDLHPLDWFGINGFLSIVVATQVWFIESLHQALLTAAFALFVFALPMRAGILPHYGRPRFPFLLSVPIIWVFLQWVVAPSPLFLGVPIDQLAYSQARVPQLIQIAKYAGAQSVDFLLLLWNCTLAMFLIEFTNIARKLPSRADVLSDKLGAVFDFILIGSLVLALSSWGEGELRRDAAMPEYWSTVEDKADAAKKTAPNVRSEARLSYCPAIPIAVVQSNLTTAQIRNGTGALVAEHFSTLCKQLGAPIVVLPARVIGGDNRGSEPLLAELPAIARTEMKDVIVGARRVSRDGTADTVHIYRSNSANEPDYLKYRLVPFAEYTPLGPLGALMPAGVREKLQGSRQPIRPFELPTPKTAFGKIGASIAPEMIYPDLIVSEVNRGASLLVNVSDLSYFHSPMLGNELIAAAALRAVENGRYFVIAGNAGGAAVVDPHGVVTSVGAFGKPGVLFDRVQFLHKKTPFTRLCLWTPLYK